MKNLVYLFSVFFSSQIVSLGQSSRFDEVHLYSDSKELNSNVQNDLANHRKNIARLSAKMHDFQERFAMYNIKDGQKSKDIPPSTNDFESNSRPNNQNFERVALDVTIDEGTTTEFSKSKFGMYFIPFIGIQYADNLSFKTRVVSVGALPDIEIEDDLGFAYGVRLGLKKNLFFLEAELMYSEVEFDEVNIPLTLRPLLTPYDFSAEVEQAGLLISGGFDYPFADFASFLIGGGLGLVSQNISGHYSFAGTTETYSEKEMVFIYQFLTGINFFISERFQIGLRYRWMSVGEGEAEFLPDRDVYLADLSIGYFF